MSDKKQLCVEISEDFCSLSEINSGAVRFIGTKVFVEKKDFQLKEQMNDFFKEKNIDFAFYEDLTVSWISMNSLLVPSAIFDIKELGNLYSTCFTKQIQSTELDYNRLSELSVVNIYEIPLWVKSFFVLRFPRVVIQHENSIHLHALMKNAFKLNIQLNVYQHTMSLQIVAQNELLYCNSFEIQQENDVIYYLSFVLQQLKLVEEKGNLTIHSHDFGILKKDEFLSNLSRINTFKNFNIEFNSEKTIKSHQLCV